MVDGSNAVIQPVIAFVPDAICPRIVLQEVESLVDFVGDVEGEVARVWHGESVGLAVLVRPPLQSRVDTKERRVWRWIIEASPTFAY